MPTPKFSKDVTSIFNSNDLLDEIKYDITCRLVCNALRACNVSMLIYDAQSDKLICKGGHLSPKARSKYICEHEHYEKIIEHIAVFEYFASGIANIEKAKLDDLIHSPVIDETNNNFEVTAELFSELKSLWLNEGYQSHYKKYKASIHSETHPINSNTLSGKYFAKLLAYGTQLTSEIEIGKILDAPQKGEPFFSVWQQLGITIPSDDLHYIGLPLFANERYTGIIRILVSANDGSSIEEIFAPSNEKQEKEEKEKEFQRERLNNFAQIISLHLKTNYYLDGYRILSNLKMDARDFRPDKGNLNDVCNTLVSVIRCKGCMIRFKDNPAVTANPPVKGISNSLLEYQQYLNRNGMTFSDDIYDTLRPKLKDEKRIRAINFSIEDINSTIFKTIDYYYAEDEKLDSEIHPGRQFHDFTPEYNSKLIEFGMSEIVVLTLEYLDNGFLILTNTSHRKFTRSDIEMILLASKRIGMEIKHFQDTERINEQNKIIAQDEHAKIIVHQIGSMARAMSGHAQNLEDGIIKKLDQPQKISQMNRMIYGLFRKINSIQKYLDWETKPMIPKKEEVYPLESYVRSRAIQYEGLTVGRNIRIWTIIRNPENFNNTCTFNLEMFDEILNCLLDNAVKYSFSNYEREIKVKGFREKDPLTEGHIHIRLYSDANELVMSIENYGNGFEKDEKDIIFERSVRGKKTKKEGPSGSGIGLYLVKKVVLAFKGKIEAEYQSDPHKEFLYKTTFKVTLPYEQ